MRWGGDGGREMRWTEKVEGGKWGWKDPRKGALGGLDRTNCGSSHT